MPICRQNPGDTTVGILPSPDRKAWNCVAQQILCCPVSLNTFDMESHCRPASRIHNLRTTREMSRGAEFPSYSNQGQEAIDNRL